MKTKAGTNRTVPIHPRIRPLVIKWYNKAQELNSEYLFNCTDTSTARSNLMLTYDKYRRRIEALVDALELNPDHRPHDGRNTFITMCKNAGVDEYAIKTMAVSYTHLCKAKTGAFGIAGLISADEAFCNFFRIEGELGCGNIFQADKYIFLRLFDFHINSCSRKCIFYNVIQKILKDPAGLLTVQTKNHFFFLSLIHIL